MFTKHRHSYWLLVLLAFIFVVVFLVQNETSSGREKQTCALNPAAPQTIDTQSLLLLLEQLKAKSPIGPLDGPVEVLQSLEPPPNGKVHRTESPNCNVCRPSRDALLGHLPVDAETLKQQPWREFDEIQLGGRHLPSDCCPEEKLAIIIPFRNREEHLKSFVQHMHPILIRQKRYYTIYFIDQADEYPFNRATLFNVGVQEALKQDNYDCYIFHDIDTLPGNDRLLYKCSDDRNEVLHFPNFQSKWNYTVVYFTYSGGVVAMTNNQFMRMNGMSNCYWGWGAEDDDMKMRVLTHNFKFTKVEDETARFFSLGHDKAVPSESRLDYLRAAGSRLSVDGLNSLRYRLLGVDIHRQYTRLRVLLDKDAMNLTCSVSK